MIIRKVRLPDDYPYIAALLNHILSEPTTAQNLEDDDSKIPAEGSLHMDESGLLGGFDRNRLVAVNEEDMPIAYGISWRAPWTAGGELNHTLVVDPQHRNQGIGRELYTQLEKWARDIGASRLNYEVRDEDVNAIQFARMESFETERHSFESILELASFDIDQHLSAISNVQQAGIAIQSLAELTEADSEQKLYECYKETTADIPGFRGHYFDFHEWRKWTLELPGSKPEYVLIALDGARFVGVCHLLFNVATSSMYHEFTGVSRSHRGQGIAMALKVQSILVARAQDAKYMRTNNDSTNMPMLNINRDKLGFEAVPGNYLMVKRL